MKKINISDLKEIFEKKEEDLGKEEESFRVSNFKNAN